MNKTKNMKKSIVIICLLISNYCNAQNSKLYTKTLYDTPFRKEASSFSDTLFMLPAGTNLKIVELLNDLSFRKVEYNNTIGFVRKNFCEGNAELQTQEENLILEEANKTRNDYKKFKRGNYVSYINDVINKKNNSTNNDNKSNGYISTIKIKKSGSELIKYDSISNFVDYHPELYVGQEMYLKCLDKGLQEYGYPNFFNDFTDNSSFLNDKTNIYKPSSSVGSTYKELNGKIFKVLDVIQTGSLYSYLSGGDYFLKILDKSNSDTLYYKYDARNDFDFPFIVCGYFEKMKHNFINQQFVLRGINWLESSKINDSHENMIDINTGQKTNITAGSEWKCSDLSVTDDFCQLSLILKNKKGESLAYSLNDLSDIDRFMFTKYNSNIYKQKFGIENYNLILSGKVKIGMTKTMCKISWGEPDSKNKTILKGKQTEQHVYKNSYLYFDNDILIVISN